MKLLKTLTAGLLTVAMTGMASAATTLHLTGSTAFRASATVAIINQLGGTSCRCIYYNSSPVGGGVFQMFANGTVGVGGSATTIVLTQWTGSLAGVVDLVSQNTALNFINPTDATVVSDMNSSAALCTAVTTNSSPQGYTGGKLESSTPALTPSAPDAAFTDAFQTSVAASVATCGTIASPGININGTLVTNGSVLAQKVNAATLVEAGSSTPGAGTATGTVGIIPFEWVLGNYAGYTGSNAPFSNITQQTALSLIQLGSVPIAFFNPALSANTTDFAYLIGRSEDSGTRIVDFAEPQNGFGNGCNQFELSFSANQKTTGALPQPTTGLQTGGTGSTVQTIDYWPSNAPVNTLPKINWNTTGHGGYVSGGDVGNVLASTDPLLVNTSNTVNDGSSVYIPNAPFENTPTSQGGTGGASPKAYVVGYIGIADAGGTVTTIHNGTLLTYNGVAYSPAAVTSGAYSLWGFEHFYYISSGFDAIGTAQKAIADTLADSISSTYAPSDKTGNVNSSTGDGAGIIYSATAGVTRSAEGAPITINY